MTLKLEHHPERKDIEISIAYPVKNKTVDRIVSLIKSADKQIECYSDDGMKRVDVSDVYYIESIDKRTIVFCEKENYQIRKRLYQAYEELADNGFVKISKYCILNINKLEKITPLLNSHMEAVLSNGKCLYVTRKYLADIKQMLKENE